MAENVVDEIVADVEELFDYQPKPGGMIDRHRQESARREAAQKEREQASEKVEERTYKAVKTIVLSPEVTNVNQVNIGAGATAMVLPNSPYRAHAWLVASAAISLGKDQAQVTNGGGFPIAANTPFPVVSRAQLWAFAAGATVVNVLTETYGPEQVS
jgi:hypothetical protein